MKNREIFAIVDKKLEDMIAISYANNAAVAIRDFSETVKKVPQMSKHAEDYCLIRLAEIDDELNIVSAEKKMIIEAKTILDAEEKEKEVLSK